MKKWNTKEKEIAFYFFLIGFVLGCTLIAGVVLHKDNSRTGRRRHTCYPNSTCNQGLTCIDTICVEFKKGDKLNVKHIEEY